MDYLGLEDLVASRIWLVACVCYCVMLDIRVCLQGVVGYACFIYT